MRIIAHRGLWTDLQDQNSIQALTSAVKQGFAIEVDVHSYRDKIVISHDPPNRTSPDFRELLVGLEGYQALIALNIKQDGLALRIKKLLIEFSSQNLICFDMSTPQLNLYKKMKLPYLSRVSDLELIPLFLQDAVGLWIDSFSGDYPNLDFVRQHLDAGKLVAYVSPELHNLGRDQLWDSLDGICEYPNLLICTDFPLEAKERWG